MSAITTLESPLLSPTLEESRQRYAMARERAQALVAELDDATFHRAPAAGSWSVAECLEHLVVSGGKMAAKLETATKQARVAGRIATAEAARAPVRLGWFARFFIAQTGPAPGGGRPGMKVPTRPPFEPGDPRARGRGRDAVLGDFLALQDRLDAVARAADGLDLSGVKVESVLADWIRIPLGAWFVAVAGHQERHLDQAQRARAALEAAA